MNYLNKILVTVVIFIAAFLVPPSASAQRRYSVNDSTLVVVGIHDTLIVGRHKIYKKNGASLTTIKEFTDLIGTNATGIERGWIRDFDFWNSEKWHVIIGKSIFGDSTVFYKTNNAGLSWEVDTSFYPASFYKSLNQMQIIDNDNAFLFDSYYSSYVLETTDGGQTWTRWLQSLFANHYGIFICNTDNYYLWGLYGDGFKAYMFRIPDNAFGATNYYVSCTLNPECIEAPSSVLFHIDQYFRPIFDSICSGEVSNSMDSIEENNFIVSPNPAHDLFVIKSNLNEIKWKLLNFLGKEVLRGEGNLVSIKDLPASIYFIEINSERKQQLQKIIKE